MSSRAAAAEPKRAESAVPSQNLARQSESEQRTLADAETKVKALLNYLRLDDPIHQAKCFPQLGQAAASVNHMGSSAKHGSKRRSEQLLRASKAAQLEALRKELDQLPALEVMLRLRTVFNGYCSKRRCLSASKYEMDVLGFLRLLKDTRLLDNKLTILQADAIFCGPRGVRAEDPSPASSDGAYITFETFLAKLKRALRTKAPSAPPLPQTAPQPRSSYSGGPPLPARKSLSGCYNSMPPPLTEDPEIIAITRSQILPYSRAQSEVKAVEVIFTAPMLELLRHHDAQLRAMYAAYAGLDESDPQHTSWEYVRSAGVAVGRTELMLLLLNYQVLPVLLAKHEALEELGKHRHELLRAGAEGPKKDPISLPAFIEALAMLALYIADRAKERILDSLGSPEDMRRLQRYVHCCEGELRQQLQAALTEAAQQWSARFARAKDTQQQWLDLGLGQDSQAALSASGGTARFPWLHSCGGDLTLAGVKHQAWQREQQAAVSGRLAVMARREDTRMKHALARLRNSYRDVRTAPMHMHAAAAAAVDLGQSGGRGSLRNALAAHPGPHAHHAAGGEAGEAEDEPGPLLNSVAFFSGSLQIKTPKPLASSVGHLPAPWNQGTAPAPAPLAPSLRTSVSPACGQAQQPYPSDAPADGGGAWNRGTPGEQAMEALMSLQQHEALQLLSSIVQAGMPPTRDGLLSFVAGYGFVPMPTPKAQLEPIEARDEYELMQRVAERLPALKL